MHVYYLQDDREELSDLELEAISSYVNSAGMAEELADSMEICLSQDGIHTSLKRWLMDVEGITIPTRSYLIRHLRSIGMQETAKK